MVRNTGRLTDKLAQALRVFGHVPMEICPTVNTTGFFGKQKRRFRILERRGLLERVHALQSGYLAYQLTPEGMGEIDHWATTRRNDDD